MNAIVSSRTGRRAAIGALAVLLPLSMLAATGAGGGDAVGAAACGLVTQVRHKERREPWSAWTPEIARLPAEPSPACTIIDLQQEIRCGYMTSGNDCAGQYWVQREKRVCQLCE